MFSLKHYLFANVTDCYHGNWSANLAGEFGGSTAKKLAKKLTSQLFQETKALIHYAAKKYAQSLFEHTPHKSSNDHNSSSIEKYLFFYYSHMCKAYYIQVSAL